MSDRYIPKPHDAQYRPERTNQGEAEAIERGCPYAWNTPEWHVWNDGYQKALSWTFDRLSGKRRQG